MKKTRITLKLDKTDNDIWEKMGSNKNMTQLILTKVFPTLTEKDIEEAKQSYYVRAEYYDQPIDQVRAVEYQSSVYKDTAETYKQLKQWCKPYPAQKVLPIAILKKMGEEKEVFDVEKRYSSEIIVRVPSDYPTLKLFKKVNRWWSKTMTNKGHYNFVDKDTKVSEPKLLKEEEIAYFNETLGLFNALVTTGYLISSDFAMFEEQTLKMYADYIVGDVLAYEKEVEQLFQEYALPKR